MPRPRLNFKLLRRYLKSLGALAVLALVLVIVQPWLWRFIRETAVRFQQDRSQVFQVAEAQQSLAAIKQEREALQAQLPQLTAIVPEETATLSRLERLEAMAGAVGVTMEVRGIAEESPIGSQPEAPPAAGVVVFPLAITISASGSPTALLDYIDAVEHMEELAHIRSVRLSPNQAGGAAGTFSLTAEILFYLQRHATGTAS